MSRIAPVFSLIEVLMHELANPVQAARTALKLWQEEAAGRELSSSNRVRGLDVAFEHMATVIRCVQAVKESALLPPSNVSSEKLRADLLAESRSFEIRTQILKWPSAPVFLKMHGGAIPLMLLSWAAVAHSPNHLLKLVLENKDGVWRLIANLREGEVKSVCKAGSTADVAGFAGAIGEFMLAAGGSVMIYEDDRGVYELELRFKDGCDSE